MNTIADFRRKDFNTDEEYQERINQLVEEYKNVEIKGNLIWKDMTDITITSKLKYFKYTIGSSVVGVNAKGLGHLTKTEINEIRDLYRKPETYTNEFAAYPYNNNEWCGRWNEIFNEEEKLKLIERFDIKNGDLLIFIDLFAIIIGEFPDDRQKITDALEIKMNEIQKVGMK